MRDSLRQTAEVEAAIERDPDFFRALVESSEDVVVVLDQDGSVVYASPSLRRNLGCDAVKPGARFWDSIHPEDVERGQIAFDQVLRERRGGRAVELRLLRSDGSWRSLAARAGLFRAGGGETHLVVTGHDIGDRKQVEAELRRTRDVLDGIVTAAPLGVSMLDLDAKVRIWNPAMERILGWGATDVLGRPAPAADERDRRAQRAWHERCLGGEALDAVEQSRGRRDGSPVRLRAWSRPVHDGDGSVVGSVTVVEDVTDRRRLEEAAIRAEKLDSLGVLAGGVAHDFNNILGTIMARASLALPKLAEDDPARAHLGAILEASHRAAELARKMLAFSGHGRFEIRRLKAASVLERTRGLLQAVVPPRVRLELHAAADAPDFEADPGQIDQALLCLVLNAVEAIGDGAGTIRVGADGCDVEESHADTLRFTGESLPAGHYARLTVEDDGSGMAPEVLARALEPFFTTRFIGRGLGLSAVLGIVRGHRGGIAIDSEPGRGSRVELLFPVPAGGG